MNDIQLCGIVEGVEAVLQVGAGVVRVVVTAPALQEDFGATEQASSWLGAFQKSADSIQKRAEETHRSTGKGLVVIDAAH